MDPGEDDVFVVGPKNRGLPAEMLGNVPQPQRIRVPMVPGSRSLNVSKYVGGGDLRSVAAGGIWQVRVIVLASLPRRCHVHVPIARYPLES